MPARTAPAILPSLVPLTEEQRALAGRWVPLTQRLASELGTTPQEKADLFAEFQLVLMRCARGFDPARGFTMQALVTRACYNARVSFHRKQKTRAEVGLLDSHIERDAIPVVKRKPDPEAPPEKPPTARELAKQAALSALKDGSLYRVARTRAAAHLQVSMRQIYRWAESAGIRRPCGRPRLLRCAPSGNADAAARSCGVHRSTIFRSRKIVTSATGHPAVSARVDSGHMPDIDPKKVRAAIKLAGKSMSDLSYDMSVSEGYLHRLLRTGEDGAATVHLPEGCERLIADLCRFYGAAGWEAHHVGANLLEFRRGASCKGAWALGNNCQTCWRCRATDPQRKA